MRRDRPRPGATWRVIWAVVTAAVLVLSAASPVAAQASPQKKSAAKNQFERAEKLRTALRGKPQKDRTLKEYQQLVSTYRHVYLITPHALEVPAALLAAAETYQEMGRQFDPKFYQAAIDAYQFLLHEYPASRYRMDALFTIAQIQQTDLGKPDAAELTYQEYIRRFPQSPRVEQAKRALDDIAVEREAQKKAVAGAVAAEAPSPQGKTPQVLNLRYWNAENYTRIVVDLEDTMKWRAERIANPDRIYFDLHKARLSSTLAGKTFTVEDGFLKTIRVAPNQVGVVRVVLEVDKVKDYSVFLLPNPYRLVVDVYGERVVVAKAEKSAEPKPEAAAPPKKSEPAKVEPSPVETAKAEPPNAAKGKSAKREVASSPPAPPSTAQPKSDGTHSLTRALGLKIGRIVIDAGHGGHDTGTIGPSGLMEKELCLDLALRLGKTIQGKMPWVEVHYTREDDTFIPLENRTALANQLKADMFVSIHANSSRDRGARGIETYYLSFSTSEEAMEVAARENAWSQSSIHELQDLIKQIARNEKIEESRELAQQVQEALSGRMQRYSRYVKNRGVKKAPFVVLIGANMPSVLTEISFLSNPSDEAALKKTEHRKRVVEGIFKGVESYLTALGTIAYNQQKAAEPDR